MAPVVVGGLSQVEYHARRGTLELVGERLVVAMDALHEGTQESHCVRGDALCEEVSVIGLLHTPSRAGGVTARRTLRPLGYAGTTVARSGNATTQARTPPLA